MPLLILSREAIRSLRCDGHAKVRGSLPMNSIGKGMKSGRQECGFCFTNWSTAFKAIKKHVKEKTILIGTINFCLSMIMGKDFFMPVISVDTKKKENLGHFSNQGREYRPQGQPLETNMHDFPDEELGKAIPYGVYDIGRNEGWVNVGINHDTAQFAANSIRRWWTRMGSDRFPNATR